MIIDRRVCAEVEGPFVVFLIGMRINRWWKFWQWLPVIRAMGRMLPELARQPELGLLHARSHFGFPGIMLVQYWRSYAALEAYASARDKAHLPAWAAFNRSIGSNGDVGIWHETYLVEPGRYENVYNNMPAWGLGRAGTLHDASGPRARALGRLQAGKGDER
ncbi:MAG: hypothetical protein RL490_1158 [Pseudomonadota bacterium]|jgi:hypothetical protein